jgi:uncharacterized protein (TIGR03437 family)
MGKLALLFGLLEIASAQNGPSVQSVITAGAFGGYNGLAAPASWIEIYGTNLAGSTQDWTTQDFTNGVAPVSLGGVTVTVGDKPAYVRYVSPGQVNVQVPDSAATGTSPVVVTYQGKSSGPASLTLNAQEPGLLAPASFQSNGRQYLAALHGVSGSFVANGNITGVSPAPATPGETLILYGVGFGPVRQGTVAGQIASGQTQLANPISISIGGANAAIAYAGLAPGLVGLYQFNVTVPANLAAGDQPVAVTVNGAPLTRQSLFLPIAAASNTGTFTLTSAAGVDGGALPAEYTCDGSGATIPLAWASPPTGAKEYALLMTTLPGDGTTKWNWVVYNIPGNRSSLPKDFYMIGTTGIGSDGPGQVYNPPCSQGPGTKLYTYTLYALSGTPKFSVPAAQVTGQMVTDAIAGLTLGRATLNLNATRATNPTGSSANCVFIRNSTRASKSGTASVSCDATYAYVGSIGITTQTMMNGITSTNLQVPIPVNFNGSRGWKIPVNPAIAAAPTSVVDGPMGVAINGVPIFNPCTQGGCVTGGDTKALGQLDACNGHAGRADDYHYHAAPTCMMADQPATYWDTHPLGWALDGFAIFGYRDADGSVAQRDSICGGNTKALQNSPAGYAYHVTDTPPYVSNCLIGTPSPDLPNQGSKYNPLRQPPVTPFNVSGMTLITDPTDGYQVLQFTSGVPFRSTENGTDTYNNPAGTYKIRYKQVLGDALAALLAQRPNATACWEFQFINNSAATTQPTVSYCK